MMRVLFSFFQESNLKDIIIVTGVGGISALNFG